jgi:hypothetical protein
VFLYPVCHRKHGREGVCELQDTEGGDDTGQAREIGNTGGKDESDGPVNRDQGGESDFSATGGESGSMEQLDEDVVVDDWGEGVST